VGVVTPSEVSQQLEIPPATLRRYVSLFGEHLSEEATAPRGRQFGDADLATLARIRAMLSEGSSVDDVHEALRTGTVPEVEGGRPQPSDEPQAPAPAPQETDAASAPAPEPEPAPDAPVGVPEEEPTAPAGEEARPGSDDALTVAPEPADSSPEARAADEAGEDEEADELEERPRWRTFARVQPVRSSREARKMAADLAGTDHLSQRMSLAEDRIMTSNERMAVLEARIARLEEWLRMPWYRRLFAKPPEYDL